MKYDAKQTHQIIHPKTERALQTTEQSIDNDYKAQTGPLNSNNKRQLWLLQGQNGGTFEIVNGFTDQVLTQYDDSLIMQKGSANKHQTWLLQFVSDHQFYIKLAKSKCKYVCVDKGELRIKECRAPFVPDVWLLNPVRDNLILNRSCFIISTDTKKLIDVPGATKQQGAHILIYQPNYRYNQRWNIYRAGEIYVIKSHLNDLNLDVEGEKFQHHSPIVQWPNHGAINQFWKFQRVGANSVFRISTVYDKELELGHYHGKLVLNKGREFTWQIEGYFPE